MWGGCGGELVFVMGEELVVWAMCALYGDCGVVRCILCEWYVCILGISGGFWNAVVFVLGGGGRAPPKCGFWGALMSIPDVRM